MKMTILAEREAEERRKPVYNPGKNATLQIAYPSLGYSGKQRRMNAFKI